MHKRLSFTLAFTCLIAAGAKAQDASPHQVRFVTVERDVRLEVLDWGGTGRPLVLLAGLGGTAHDLDDFAAKLAGTYHVYAVTRRGYGRSSAPRFGYDADELGNDVLAVIDSLGLKRPVVAGHSIAGSELSSIGSRHPEKVSGLIYLDAGLDYAFYDTSIGHATIDINEAIRRLEKLRFGSGATVAERRAAMRSLSDTALPSLLKRFQWELAQPMPQSQRPPPLMDRVSSAIFAGQRKYTTIRGPVLAIFAAPSEAPSGYEKDPAMRAMVAEVDSSTEKQVSAFARGVPQARVVRIPRASHFVFQSHEAEVLAEMRAFIDALPRVP